MRCICVVCQQEYEPDFERGGKFARIYCSARCAWGGDGHRDQASLKREHAALKQLLEEKPS